MSGNKTPLQQAAYASIAEARRNNPYYASTPEGDDVAFVKMSLRIEVLEQALRPFAIFGAEYDETFRHHSDRIIYQIFGAETTAEMRVGDIRRAAELLKET